MDLSIRRYEERDCSDNSTHESLQCEQDAVNFSVKTRSGLTKEKNKTDKKINNETKETHSNKNHTSDNQQKATTSDKNNKDDDDKSNKSSLQERQQAEVSPSSVLQALGLSRASTNNLHTKNPSDSVTNLLAAYANPSSMTSSKPLPLLVKAAGATAVTQPPVPSILPANLPPGRYVIISSTTAPSNTSTQISSVTSSSKSSPVVTSMSTTSPNSSSDINATLYQETSKPINSDNSALNSLKSPTLNSPTPPVVSVGSPSLESPPSPQQPPCSSNGIKTPVGKTRGMRKSYTASEKLAMIEAVESGLKKSVVADRFGVAPSTLACIILQKEKIRRDQSFRSNSVLNKRRIRPSLPSRKHSFENSLAPKNASSKTSPACTMSSSVTNSSPPVLAPPAPVFSCLQPPYSTYGALSNALSSNPLLGAGVDSITRNVLPFTHFLANFDQSFAFETPSDENIEYRQPSPVFSDHRGASEEDLGEEPRQSGRNGVLPAAEKFPANLLDATQEVKRSANSNSSSDDIQGQATHSNIQEPNIEIETTESLKIATESAKDVSNVAPPSAEASNDAGELSGLCMVKRQIHCYSVLDQLMKDETYTDVTITTEGQTFKAHKIVLCMASNYFKRVLNDNAPGVRNIVVLRDISSAEMKNIMQFIYTGEATLDASELQSFMKTAKLLEINSLCDNFPSIPVPTPNTVPSEFPSEPSSGSPSTTSLLNQQLSNQEANAFTPPLLNPQYQFFIQQQLKRRLEAFARQTMEQNMKSELDKVISRADIGGTKPSQKEPSSTCKEKHPPDSDAVATKTFEEDTVQNETGIISEFHHEIKHEYDFGRIEIDDVEKVLDCSMKSTRCTSKSQKLNSQKCETSEKLERGNKPDKNGIDSPLTKRRKIKVEEQEV